MEKRNFKIEYNAPIDKDALWEDIASHPDFPGQNRKRRSIYLLSILLALSLSTALFFHSFERDTLVVENNESGLSTQIDESQQFTKPEDSESSDIVIPNKYDRSERSLEYSAQKEDLLPVSEEELVSSISNPSTVNGPKVTELKALQNEDSYKVEPKIINENMAVPRTLEKRISGVHFWESNIYPIEKLEKPSLENSGSIWPFEPLIRVKSELDVNMPDLPNELQNNVAKNEEKDWSLGFFLGLGYAMHDIEIENDSFSGSQVLKSYENSSRVYSGGLRLEKRILESKWSVAMELDYSLFYLNLNHMDSSSGFRTISQSSSPYFEKYDSTSHYLFYHHHHTINGALSVARNWNLSARSGLQVYAGIGFNIWYDVSGNLLVDDQLSPIPNQMYKSRLSPNLNLGTTYYHSLNDRFRLGLGVDLRTSQTLNSDHFDFSHQVMQYRLKALVEYSFGG